MVEVREYEDEDGESPFAKWFSSLNSPASLKISTSIARMENGNFSNVEGVGQGVSECKINFGPGYRVYFGKDGEQLIILLYGGQKKRQSRDIGQAQEYWKDYKRRKKKGLL
jgi:putative addiction module killer protein